MRFQLQIIKVPEKYKKNIIFYVCHINDIIIFTLAPYKEKGSQVYITEKQNVFLNLVQK